MTKIFCDIADINTIKKYSKKKIVKGFTTNPSLMRKAGAKDYIKYARQILKSANNKPVSLEVFADDYFKIVQQALVLNSLNKNVYVKIPVTNSNGIFMGRVIRELNERKIKLNITAVYTSSQTKRILSCIKKRSKVIISIFAGRMADVKKDPVPEFKRSISLSRKFKNVDILWASTREVYNFTQAKQIRCQIITIPPSIISKIEKSSKSFNQLTKETVKTFLDDAKKSKFKI